MSWVDAGPLDAIPRRGARVLRAAERCVAVFRTGEDEVFALEDRCPHQGGPLSQGIVHGRRVTCPLHEWVIELATGEAAGPDEGATGTYSVRVENGRVLVATGTDADAGDGDDAEVPAEATAAR